VDVDPERGFHTVDLALSRLVSLAATWVIELRLEVFNLQYLQLGLPNNNFGSGSFERITTMTGIRALCSSASSTASEE
jgi:hypothetical protein